MINIIDILIDGEIPFSVVVGNLTISRGMNMHVKEYYLIAMISDLPRLKNHGFTKGEHFTTRMGVIQRVMDDSEVAYFKRINNLFIKVMQDKDAGRVYELKDSSFLKHYKSKRYAATI